MALICVVHVGSGRDAAVWRLGRRWTGNSAADRWRARRPVTGGRSWRLTWGISRVAASRSGRALMTARWDQSPGLHHRPFEL